VWLLGAWPMSGTWDGGKNFAPLVDMALSTINNNAFRSYTLKMDILDSQCNKDQMIKVLAKNVEAQNYIGLVGPICSSESGSAADVGGIWQLFPLSTAGNPDLSLRAQFPYFMRIALDVKSAGVAWVALLQKLGVKRIALVKEPGEARAAALYEYLYTTVLPGTDMEISFSGEFGGKGDAALIANEIKSKDIRYILFPAFELAGQHLCCALYKAGLRTGQPYNVLFTFGFWNEQNFYSIDNDKYGPPDCTTEEIWLAGVNVIGTEINALGSDDNAETMTGRTPSESLQEYEARAATAGLTPNIYAYFVYDAIFLWARMLDRFFESNVTMLSNQPMWRDKAGHQNNMYRRLRSSENNFYGMTGFVSFMYDEDPPNGGMSKYNPDRIGGTRRVWQMQRARDGTTGELLADKRNATTGELALDKTLVWKEFARFQTDVTFSADTKICWDLNCTRSYTPAVHNDASLSFADSYRPLDHRPFCGEGKYLANPEMCLECPEGFTNTDPSADFCVPVVPVCLAGQGNDPVTLQCADCPVGSFLKDKDCRAGLPCGCERCPVGSAGPTSGLSICTSCAPGSFADVEGLVDCKNCTAGTFAASVASDECTVCAPGSIAPGKGADSCLDCTVGLYQDMPGMSACKQCGSPRATFSQGIAESSACLCPSGKREVRSGNVAACADCEEGLNCEWTTYFTQDDAVRGLAEVKIRNSTDDQSFPAILPGYWVETRDHLGEVFVCTSENRCPGGLPNVCASNMGGVSCGKCDSGYYHAHDMCEACGGSMILLVLSYVGGFFVIGLLSFVWDRRAAMTEAIESYLASITMGVIISFVQTLGILGRLTFTFPIDLHNFLNAFSFFLFEYEILRPGCLLPDSLGSHYLLLLIFPVFAGGSCLVWFFLFKVGAKIMPSLVLHWNATLNTVGMLCQFLFISIAMAVFSIWECGDNPSGKKTLKSAPYTICYEEAHLGLVVAGVFLVMVYVLLPLAIYARAVYKLPHDVVNQGYSLRYKWVYFKFHPSFWWFGGLHMLRSLFLAVVPIIATDNNFNQFLLMLSILLLFGALHLLALPYVDRYANNVETYENACIVFILMLCSWYIRRESADLSTDKSAAGDGVAIIIMIVSVSCVVVLGIVTVYALYLACRSERSLQSVQKQAQLMMQNLRGTADLVEGMSDSELKELLSRGLFKDFDNLKKFVAFLGLEGQGGLADSFWDMRLATTSKNKLRRCPTSELVRTREPKEDPAGRVLPEDVPEELVGL